MTFKLDVSKTYKYDVSISMLDESGKSVKSEFTADFKRIDRKTLDDMLGKGKSKKAWSDDEVYNEVLLGWAGIEDAEGKDLPYSSENKEALKDNVLQFMPAVIKAFFTSIYSVKEKN